MKTKFLFFSGKGGVGKTTMSSATAIHYAVQGKKTLIITTDPASNLADVFEQPIGHKITPITSVKNLSAMELDPDKTTQEYKEKTLAPLRGLIPLESFKVLEEQLNSPCTAEMASFDRFTDFVQDGKFEIVIFDTAPTGHTLRLLELPVEWSGVIEKATKDGSGGQTCIGPAAALAESKAKFDRAISAMRDPNMTTFVFVLRPEATLIEEASRAMDELLSISAPTSLIVANLILPESVVTNDYLRQRKAMQERYLAIMVKRFTAPIVTLPLLSEDLMSKEKLMEAGYLLYGKSN